MLTRRAFGLQGTAALIGLSGAAKAVQSSADLSQLPPDKRAAAQAYHARMMAAFDYPRISAPGSSVLEEWGRRTASSSSIPVVIGDDEQLERLADQFTMDDPSFAAAMGKLPAVREVLVKARKIAFPADLERWEGAFKSGDLTAPIGDWPVAATGESLSGLTVATDLLSGKPLAKCNILLVPAAAAYEIPANLRWGNWNACPPAEYHVAALRRWHDLYGAELVGINADTMNVRVRRRPATRTEALELADEQYRYCPDIIDQGFETRSALAAALMASDWWYFWWD